MEINFETIYNPSTYMKSSIIKFHYPYEDSNRFLYVSRAQEYKGHVIISVALSPKWAIKLTDRKLIRKICNQIVMKWGIKKELTSKTKKTKAIPQIIPVYE
jgi:hypothetical protein